VSALTARSGITERHPPVAIRRMVHRTRGAGRPNSGPSSLAQALVDDRRTALGGTAAVCQEPPSRRSAPQALAVLQLITARLRRAAPAGD
jgi:hypothetical protein